MQTRSVSACLLVSCLLVTPSTAQARSDFLDLSVKDAKGGELGQAKLHDVPFYMAGQSHPGVTRSFV